MPSTVVITLGCKGIQRKGRLPIASGATFRAGDFLAVNSSGQVIPAIASVGSDMTVWSSGIQNLVVGRAIEDAQPNPNDPTIIPFVKAYAEFIIAEPGTWFELPLFNATPSLAYPNPNQIGSQYNFSYQTITNNSVWCVNLGTTAAAKLQVEDFLPDYYPSWPDTSNVPSTGTLSQYASAWVEFLGGACLLSGARPITRTN